MTKGKAATLAATMTALLATAAAVSAADGKYTLTAAGYNRTYYVHLPPAYDGASPIPLVLLLHGGGGKAERMASLTGFNEAADKYGFAVAYPQGLDRAWNDGRDINKLKRKADDVAFLSELCKRLLGDYNLDPGRVYCVGISNGAMMSFRFAAECPTLVAAACGVVGGVTENLARDYPLRAPVPVLMIVGDADPLVPFDGGEIAILGVFKRGRILPQEEGAKWWAEKNGASLEAEVVALPDTAPDDGCTVIRKTYPSTLGDDVVLTVIRGGGHTWPQGEPYLPEKIVGRVCRDIGNDYIWEFLAAHPNR